MRTRRKQYVPSSGRPLPPDLRTPRSTRGIPLTMSKSVSAFKLWPSEVFARTREPSSYAVMLVHHAGHAIEPEAIEHVNIHVKPEVGKQEPQNLMMAVIEEPRVP